jgi:flagella basal body P-ring formation protein FlgA
LTPPDLRRFAARNSLAVSSYQPLCFRAATQQLDAGRIQQAIEAELERHGSKPLAIVVMDHSRFPIAVGQLRMRFTGSAAGRDGVRTLSGVILGEGGRTQPIWARVRILFSELRWVATESLPAGVPIRRTQIEQKQVSTSNIPRPPSTIEQIAGLAPRRSIPAGTAVEPVALTNPTEVHGGERIRVEATAGGTRLMLPMIAESSGRRGDRVVVRNPGSGRRVPAQVAGPGLAIVGERQDRR